MGGIITPKNSKTTQSTSLPSYVTDAYKQALGLASNVQAPNYQGDLTAGSSPLQEQAYSGLAGAVGSANPYIDQAASFINSGANPSEMQQWTPEQIAKYSDPYTKSVIDATQKSFDLSNAEQQNKLRGSAASAHALGGDRVGVAQAELAKQQMAVQNPMIAKLYSDNYAQATGEFNNQQQLDLANQHANANRDLTAGGQFADLGQLKQGSTLADYGALLTAGGTQQQTEQAGLTAQYQDYLMQQGFPAEQAKLLAGIAAQMAPSTATTTTTKPGSSLLGQVAGLGLAATGLGAFGTAPLAGLFGKKKGGRVRAEGGELEDEFDTTDDMPDFAPDMEDDGISLGDAENALAGFAGPEAGLPSGAPMQIAQAQSPSPPPRRGLTAENEGLLAAGLGMMSAEGRPLDMIGQGGLTGLKAYGTARDREQKEQALEAQTGYRAAMSQAATSRAEALSKHYENTDKKPVLIKGKTFQWYYPSDGSYHDTHIDNPEYVAAGARNTLGERNAKTAEDRVKIEQKRLDNTIKMGGGAGQGGVFGYKYNAWLKQHPEDKDGALQFASGHRSMDAATAKSLALREARAQANAMKDSFDGIEEYNTYLKQQYNTNFALFAGDIDSSDSTNLVPNPGLKPAPPPPPKADIKLPPGVPAGSLYSPSRKQYKDAEGNVYDAAGKKLSSTGQPVY